MEPIQSPNTSRLVSKLCRRSAEWPAGQLIERLLSQFFRKDLNSPRSLIAGSLHTFDEATYVKLAFATQSTVIDCVLVQAPGRFEGAIVEFDADDVFQRHARNFLIGNF